MTAMIAPWKNEVIEFAVAQLEKFQPRDDYCELLELSIIFLGGIPPQGIRFRYPGGVHRTQWIARAICSLKMWIFHSQYEPLHCLQPGSTITWKFRGPSYGEQVWNHMKEVSLFVTGILYVKYWFQCASTTEAPKNDLNLLFMLSKRLMVKTHNENSGSVEPLKRIRPFQDSTTSLLHQP